MAKNLLNQSIKSEKLSLLVTNNTNLDETKLNPSKKVRLTLENSSSKSTKLKKKRKSKKKSSVLSKKSSVQSTKLSDCLTSTKFEFNEHKTPLRTTTTNRLNSILESNTKTIKAEKVQPSVHTSGKVKQMIELVEARMKNSSMTNTPATVVKQSKPQYSNSVCAQSKKTVVQQPTTGTTKRILRSSIDERKKRISTAKNEIKRQSTKRINAFLNDITQTIVQKPVQPVSTVKKKLNYQATKIEVKEEPLEHCDDLINRSKAALSNLIASNASVQQQYRLKHTSSLNTETKGNFNRFLERNTPCKLTKNVIFVLLK